MMDCLVCVLSLFPLFSQVSAFGYCDASIILNIENSNLTAFPAPKIALFSNQRFLYNYVSSTDARVFQSTEIIFETSTNHNEKVSATLNRYLGGSSYPISSYITFTDIGDAYEVNAKGFINGPRSNNQVYVWSVENVVVAYYCSLDCTCTGNPLFTINAPTDYCDVTPTQLKACQDTINLVNNNQYVSLTQLAFPPTSVCYQQTII